MPDREEVLRLENISKAFFNVYALQNISLSVGKGEILGIIGENGAGKSTMMNIIGGVLQPDGGSMKLNGKPYTPQNPSDAKSSGIAFIHQELNLFNNLSVVDNIYISSFEKHKGTPFIKRNSLRSKVQTLLESIDLYVSPDILVEKLSPGERQLVEIAKELSGNPDLIIFDEPTTSLTARETKKLFDLIKKLRDSGKSIIYISHILADVQELSNNIVVLRDGVITDKGGIKDFSIDRMISSMVGRDIKQMYPEDTPVAKETTLLEVKNLSQPGIVHDINLHVNSGEIVGVFGLMGSGRSELAQIIFGLEPYEEGEISFSGKPFKAQDPVERIDKGIAFVTENRREEGLLMEFSVYNNLCLASLKSFAKRLGIIDDSKLDEPVDSTVKELRIKSGAIKKHQVKGLSGGNQQKVVLGKWMLTKPSMMIIDEPTRGIDVGAKAEIYKILNDLSKSGTGSLIISSELEELTGICNRIIVMSRGEIVGSFTSENFDRQEILRAAFRQNVAAEIER